MLSLYNNRLHYSLTQALNDLQNRTKLTLLSKCKTDDGLRDATRKLDIELSRIFQFVRATVEKVSDSEIDLIGFDLLKAPTDTKPGMFDFITTLHHAVPELKTDKELNKLWESFSESVKKTLVLNYVITATKDISFSITPPSPQAMYEAVVK